MLWCFSHCFIQRRSTVNYDVIAYHSNGYSSHVSQYANGFLLGTITFYRGRLVLGTKVNMFSDMNLLALIACRSDGVRSASVAVRCYLYVHFYLSHNWGIDSLYVVPLLGEDYYVAPYFWLVGIEE